MSSYKVNFEFGKCPFVENKELANISNDSKPVLWPNLKNISTGSIYFDKHCADAKHIPFMLAPYAVDAEEVMTKLLDDWNLPLPKIIAFVIADIDGYPTTEYRNLSCKLVKGIIYALNTIEMWLLTEGLNYGFSKDIGKAFETETCRRKTLEGGMEHAGFPKATLIGICEKEKLEFSKKFVNPKVNSEEDKKEYKIRKDVNRQFDYFIAVDDTTEVKNGVSKFILKFVSHVTNIGIQKLESVDLEDSSKESQIQSTNLPVIILLLHGKIIQIDLILGHLKLGLPLVVLEGSGGLADLLAFAYSQTNYRPEGRNIAEYTESVLKPQISTKVRELYPDFSDFKISLLIEKVFNCIRHSKQHGQECITVLDINSVEYDPLCLPRYLLKALFKSQIPTKVKDVREMKKDLLLAMDWNSADVAMKEVFTRDRTSKFQIDEETFFMALTKPQREKFVSLFMDQGFVLHTYLNSSNLLKLFHNSLNKQFFRFIVWERLLGFDVNVEMSRKFLDETLVILLEDLTGIPGLINSYELDFNASGFYDNRISGETERKAVAVLVLWAILSYRIELVKVILKHSEQPVHHALVCSMILKKLVAFVTDMNVKNEMEIQSNEFSHMAIEVMSLCYENVPCRALDLLKEKSHVWSQRDLMEIAAIAKNKTFLSHRCCQKYLDNIFLGRIKIRNLPYGDFTVPLWLKIIFSAFLIFPIYLWARFVTSEKIERHSNVTSTDRSAYTENTNIQGNKDQKPSSRSKETNSNMPRFFCKIYYFWSAPITKFWIFHVSYLLFLICFSLAVIWPACGNTFLDFVCCIWIAAFVLDSMYHIQVLHKTYNSMPLFYKCLEIPLMIWFLFNYAMGRIIWKQVFMTPYNAKVMLCVALLYSYYRLIFTAISVSPGAGPMLLRVKRAAAVDFITYVKVTIVVLISSGIVMHAVIYPDFPLNWELVRRAFYDTIITFFLIPSEHYGIPDPKCIPLKRHFNKVSFVGYSQDSCKVGRYYKSDCPNPGVWPYLFGIQYIITLRLILDAVLYSLFSNTIRKLEDKVKNIWRYQRYELVVNFSSRLTLPPPLSILTFVYMIIKYCIKFVLRYCKMYQFEETDSPDTSEILDENDFRYWKSIARLYYEKQKQNKATEMTVKKRMKRINGLIYSLNKQSRILMDLIDHLNELEIETVNAHQYLEDKNLQISMRERLSVAHVPNIFSRISPYSNTMIYRFPVSDNRVPWQCIWNIYDPIAFTLLKEDFPPNLRPYVDVDIQRNREDEGEEFRMPHFTWNKLFVSPAGICIDRQSWITDNSDEIFLYELDSEQLPRNPAGRTGLKGRGCLPRWGPNHYLYVIITRWYVEDEYILCKHLDIILMKSNGDLSLPGGYVSTENRYEFIRSFFQCKESWKTCQDMIAYFASLSQGKRFSMVPKGKKGFSSERIKLGYMDDEKNTDQAWCEAEVWHFHYNSESKIDVKFKVNMQWYVLNEDKLLAVPIGQAAILRATAKKMKAILEVA